MKAEMFVGHQMTAATHVSEVSSTTLTVKSENDVITLFLHSAYKIEDLRSIISACEEGIAKLEAQHESGSS